MWPDSVVYVTITSLREVMLHIVRRPLFWEFFPYIPKWYDSYECNTVINLKQTTPVIYPTFYMHFSVKCVILATPDF